MLNESRCLREMASKMEFIIKEPIDFSNSTLITGFQGIGAVGYIAVKHLVSELKPKKIGYIISKYMADTVFFENNKVLLPYEIYFYSDGKQKIVLVLNNAQPVMNERVEYASKLILWAKKNKISKGIFIGGLDKSTKEESEKDSFKCVPSSSFKEKIPGPILSKELMIIGPLALLVAFSEIYDFPSLTILPYAEILRPDPAAAAVAVNVINEILNLNIDVNRLYEDAKIIEERVKKFEEFQKALESRVKERVSHYM